MSGADCGAGSRHRGAECKSGSILSLSTYPGRPAFPVLAGGQLHTSATLELSASSYLYSPKYC